MSNDLSEPQFEFQGTWIPAGVHYDLQTGKLTVLEVVLLTVIDSYCEDEFGCVYSTKFLAKQTHTPRSSVRQAVRKLIKTGRLVKQVQRINNKKTKTLTPYWAVQIREAIRHATERNQS